MLGPAVMAVGIRVQGKTLSTGRPEMLFEGPFDTTQNMNFDVMPGGKGFVMVEADPDAKPSRFQVVFNWSADLQKRFQ